MAIAICDGDDDLNKWKLLIEEYLKEFNKYYVD